MDSSCPRRLSSPSAKPDNLELKAWGLEAMKRALAMARSAREPPRGGPDGAPPPAHCMLMMLKLGHEQWRSSLLVFLPSGSSFEEGFAMAAMACNHDAAVACTVPYCRALGLI